jgi:elongation factor G
VSEGRKQDRPILSVSFLLSGDLIEATGMDELRLEEVCSAICRDKGEVFTSGPKVILLETLRKAAEGEGKYIRQTGGSGNYGHVKLRLEPDGEGRGFGFVNEVPEALLPAEYATAAETGIREAALGGMLFGYEVTDVIATLIQSSYHETDSNPLAFQIAGALAFKQAAIKASPVLLEPVMAVEAVIPETQFSELLQDMNARRARIDAIEWSSNSAAFRALVPLRETLRSSARGRLSYPMRFARYEPVANPRGKLGDDALGVGVRNPQRPILGSSYAAAELYFDLE